MHTAFMVLLFSGCLAFAQQPTDVNGWMARGEQALKSSAHYGEAADAFQHAIDIDPSNVSARLYLGAAFFVQFIPGAGSPENLANAAKARAEFTRVLSLDTDNTIALKFLASLAYMEALGTQDLAARLQKLDQAQAAYRRLVDADPRNKEAWYGLGVVDWMRWAPRWMNALTRAGTNSYSGVPIADAGIRRNLRGTYGSLVDDGIANLKKALEIDPDYDDAMAYISVLIRERASVDDTVEGYRRDLELAGDWDGKALAARKRKALTAFLIALSPSPPPPPPPPPPSVLPRQLVNPPPGAPPAAPPPATATTQQIRVGGNVQAANLIRKVDPVYPALAKQARIQGTVRFQVVIGTDGAVRSVQLISGHPLLVDAAKDAVRQWVYRPVLLTGTPVEVITTIDVNFALSSD
jgi:TonB family protein